MQYVSLLFVSYESLCLTVAKNYTFYSVDVTRILGDVKLFKNIALQINTDHNVI